MRPKKVYIIGKITGVEKEAYNLFDEAENKLVQNGFEAVNPMKLNHEHDRTWEAFMKNYIKAMLDCDSVYLLPNWYHSKGAIIEMELAKSLGLEIINHTK